MFVIVQSPGTALDVATHARNPGPGDEPLWLWLKVLSALQYMDTVSRGIQTAARKQAWPADGISCRVIG